MYNTLGANKKLLYKRIIVRKTADKKKSVILVPILLSCISFRTITKLKQPYDNYFFTVDNKEFTFTIFLPKVVI